MCECIDIEVKKPTVSLIVPIYNLEKELSDCITSLQNQTYERLQIILIDDGSTDNSFSICKRFSETDKRISVYHHENHGVSYTRNQGIKKACGEYLMFVDGDDILLPDMVESYVEKAVSNDADVVIGGMIFREADGTTYQKSVGEYCMNRAMLIQAVCLDETGIFGYVPNKLYSTKIIHSYNIYFDEDMYAQEDLRFALTVYEKCYNVVTFNYCGYIYNHIQNKRIVPYDAIISNQLMLVKMAKSVLAPEEVLKVVQGRITEMAYVALFHAESVEEIKKLHNIENIKSEIIVDNLTGEKKQIISCFLRNNDMKIERYFRFRRTIKKVLGRKG